MKKGTKLVLLAVTVLMIATLAVSLVACNKQKLDPETRPFSMSIQKPDGVYNPFFSTSAYDSSIISMTQIGMLNTDQYGNIVCGDNEPTVVQDWYSQPVNGNTRYSFLIKNGIKFSDGQDLTIKDVLFNLYVYLDPAYTGSATIYSTNIVGLSKYRTQTAGMTESGQASWEAGFRDDAQERMDLVVDYITYFFADDPDERAAAAHPGWEDHSWNDPYFEAYKPYSDRDDMKLNLKEDYLAVANEFRAELNRDWNAINLEDYKDYGGVNAEWMVFYIQDGQRGDELFQKDGADRFIKNDKNNYIIDQEQAKRIYQGEIIQELLYLEDDSYDFNDDTLDADVAAYESRHAATLKDEIRNICIDTLCNRYFRNVPDPDETPKQGEPGYNDYVAHKYDVIQNANYSKFYQVMSYWATSTEIFTKWTAEAKSAYFGTFQTLAYPNIEGITIEKVNTFNAKSLGETHYVLNIEVEDVDPKAIYNFSYTVAPMHYYSNAEQIDIFDKAFKKWEEDPTRNQLYGFGVKFSDSSFMTDVVNADSKVKVPVGAGPYMACDINGRTDAASARDGFDDGSMIYYVRNDYFNTLGSGINNAKIKYVRYKIVESDQIVNSLANNNIDFGDPSATQDNQTKLQNAGLEVVTQWTSGYGYVGINPRFVPNITVRRAIMKAINVDLMINNYYKGDFATKILRPMSTTSWAYPNDAGIYKSNTETYDYSYDSTGNQIRAMLDEAGYTSTDSNGIRYADIDGWGTDKLEYKFTIAGGNTDHPAYSAFLNAADILNQCGMKITVVTSAKALSDLSAGKLAVWAAAWSSAIDPDMYQVYHMQSQASSVNNWGYNWIISKQDVYPTEYKIITDLSDKIDEGRSYVDQNDRIPIYKDALDLVMELAVEFPTYQRKDMSAYNSKVIDKNSLPSPDDCTPYSGLLARIWEVAYR